MSVVSASGLNLHALVRPLVTALHPDVRATLYTSTGQITAPNGNVHATYAQGVGIFAQKQSEGATALYHADKVGQEEVNRRFYLFSAASLRHKVAGIVRPLSRNGDMFELDDATWWLVSAVMEDFTASGWACVRATLQVNPPDFSHSPWWGRENTLP